MSKDLNGFNRAVFLYKPWGRTNACVHNNTDICKTKFRNKILYNRLFFLGVNFAEFPEWAHNSGKFILGCCIKFDYGSLMKLGTSVYFIAVRGELSLHANPQPPKILRYVINYSLSTNFHSSNLLVYPQYCHPRINGAWCNHNVF